MSTIPELPVDVIIRVLDCLFSSSSCFNPSFSLGPNSAWSSSLRLKNCVVLVSTQWNTLATPFLYHDVGLRRYGQLRSLLSTLSTSRKGELVRKLAIQSTFYMQFKDFTDFLHDMESVILHCPGLLALDLRPSFPIELAVEVAKMKRSHNQMNTFQNYDFGSNLDEGFQSHILKKWADSLRSLTLNVNPRNDSLKPILSFPLLEELRFIVRQAPAYTSTTPLSLPASWTLPELRSLHVRVEESEIVPHPAILAFVGVHGTNLSYIGIHHSSGGKVTSQNTHQLIEILGFCPKVEHLSLDFTYDPFPDPKPLFPRIHTIDIFASPDEVPWDAKHNFPLESFPHVKFISFFRGFPVDNLFLPPLPDHFDPTQVFTDAWFWLSGPPCVVEKEVEWEEGTVRFSIIDPPSTSHNGAPSWGLDLLEGVDTGELSMMEYEMAEFADTSSDWEVKSNRTLRTEEDDWVSGLYQFAGEGSDESVSDSEIESGEGSEMDISESELNDLRYL